MIFDFFRRKNGQPVASEDVPEPPARASLADLADLLRDADNPVADVRERIEREVLRVRPGRGMSAAEDSVNGGGGALKDVFTLGGATAGIPDAQLGWFAAQTFPGFQILSLIAQHWLVQKCLSMPVEDALRNGWTLRAGGEELSVEQQAFMADLDDQFSVAMNARQHAVWTRTHGLRLTLYMFDVPNAREFYEAPFNIDGVPAGSYRGMSQVEPYWAAPELAARAAGDPSAQDFYVPTWWTIKGRRVHRSHICVGLGDEVSDILKPSYLYAGLSVTQKIANRVYCAERVSDEAPGLATAKRIRTLYTNAAKAIARQGDMTNMLQMRARVMSNYGTDVVDKNEDLVQFDDVSLTDFPDLTMTQYQLVCSVAGVPVSKLLGTSPKGFNSTGEHEIRAYAETKKTLQETLCTPLLRGHYLRLMKSHVVPKYPQLAGLSVRPVWNPTDAPSSAEQADTNLKRAQTDQVLVDSGAIDGGDVRDRLVSDTNSGYAGLSAFGETE